MRIVVAILLLAGLTGCGPVFVPMLPRLDAKDQRKVDKMWDNMLTPVHRVDREALLDANIAFWMYTFGVDRMHMTSEKYFKHGIAVMEIDCDRANPDADQYAITIFDRQGRTVRRERYMRAEVENSALMLRGISNLGTTELGSLKVEAQVTVEIGEPTTRPDTQPAADPVTQPSTGRPQTPEQQKFRLESERRQAAAIAATQPARVGPAGKRKSQKRPRSKAIDDDEPRE